MIMKNLIITLSFCILSACLGASITTDKKLEHKMAQLNEQNSIPKHLYRIISSDEWQKSSTQKFLQTPLFDEDFIHLATKEQLPHIIQKFWDKKTYIILTLDPNKLIGRLVYEANPGGTTLYYHLYEGKIPLDAVIEASETHNKH